VHAVARSRHEGLAALSGLGYAILVFVGSAAIGGTSGAGRHSLDATEAEVAEYVRDADPARVWTGEFVALLGYALFVFFAAHVWSVVRTRDTQDIGAGAAAAVYVALAAVGTACLAPALNRAGDPVDAARFLDLRTALFAIAFLFFAAWLVAVGATALRTRALPAWLAWAAIVVGVLQLAGTPFATVDPAFTGLPTFAGFLWVAAASVLLARRVGRRPVAG
jgi:hypothetical protein